MYLILQKESSLKGSVHILLRLSARLPRESDKLFVFVIMIVFSYSWSQSILIVSLSLSLSVALALALDPCFQIQQLCVTCEWCKSVRMWDSDMWYVRLLLDLCRLQILYHDDHIARTYLLSLQQWLTARQFHWWYPWGDISRWYIVLSIRTIHERDRLLRQDDRHLCWGARDESLAGPWFISDTNMLWGMLCFGVKCERVYSPLEEDMQHHAV